MKLSRPSGPKAAVAGAFAAAGLAVCGLLALPAVALVGGGALVALGAGLAYDLRGLGARWLEWKRNLGPTLVLNAWLDRTLDGAAVAWVGVAVAWAAAGSLL